MVGIPLVCNGDKRFLRASISESILDVVGESVFSLSCAIGIQVAPFFDNDSSGKKSIKDDDKGKTNDPFFNDDSSNYPYGKDEKVKDPFFDEDYVDKSNVRKGDGSNTEDSFF